MQRPDDSKSSGLSSASSSLASASNSKRSKKLFRPVFTRPVSVPMRLLSECLGSIVNVETADGTVYTGTLSTFDELSMTCHLEKTIRSNADGDVKYKAIVIRGNTVRLIMLPEEMKEHSLAKLFSDTKKGLCLAETKQEPRQPPHHKEAQRQVQNRIGGRGGSGYKRY